MPSAAGIIVATGIMTLVNDMMQDENGNFLTKDTDMIDHIQWRVIPATAIAAGIFYGIEQINPGVATGLAAIAFFTAFVSSSQASGPQKSYAHYAPLGTLLKLTGQTQAAQTFYQFS